MKATYRQIMDLLQSLDEGISSIRRSVIINRVIYSTALLFMFWLTYQGYIFSQEQTASKVLIAQNLERSIETKARLDASETIYMDYIKNTVGLILDKLQKDNPQLKVPKAPAPRPPGLPLSEAELDRPKSERPPPTPSPAPTVIIKPGKIKRVYVTPKPLWERIFGPPPARPDPTPSKKR